MSDLFGAIKKLFRKEEIEDPPSDFLLHRFLASQQEMAPFCKEIALNIRNRDMVWEIWRTALPKAANAPFLPYAAPKKQSIDDPLVEGLMESEGYTRQKAEEIRELIDLSNNRNEVAHYYGIDLNE